MPPKITKVRFSRTSFAAVGTHNAFMRARQNIRDFFDSFRAKKIVIRRNASNKRIQTFDMYKYSNMIYRNNS